MEAQLWRNAALKAHHDLEPREVSYLCRQKVVFQWEFIFVRHYVRMWFTVFNRHLRRGLINGARSHSVSPRWFLIKSQLPQAGTFVYTFHTPHNSCACTYVCLHMYLHLRKALRARRPPSAFSSRKAPSKASWMPTCSTQLWRRRRNSTSSPNAPLSSGERWWQ
jgi:hypothetical protein